MNLDPVRSLFCIFTGEPDTQGCDPFIELAAERVKKMLRPGADEDDVRLGFLCAAEANFRYQQMKAARGKSEYTYAGKLDIHSDTAAVTCAERLLRDYYQLCEDLIVPRSFVFMGIPAAEEEE